MVSPIEFRCTGCGNCCRSLRVAITTFDLTRLVRATQLAPGELVQWLTPDEVDMVGEPGSFVELSEGRRLMVLRQREGACRLLLHDDSCGAYAARPRDCRAYPFDFEPGPVRRLTLLPLAGCDYAMDGQNDPRVLAAEDGERWQELTRYQAQVAAWNRRAWHRRRLHKPIGGPEDFLAHLSITQSGDFVRIP